MFERNTKLFHELMEMSPSWSVKLILSNLGITPTEMSEMLYHPTPGTNNDFDKMMKYKPMTEDCAEKLSICLGDPWSKAALLSIDNYWKELLEKKGLPIEAYQDFFQYCFGFEVL